MFFFLNHYVCANVPGFTLSRFNCLYANLGFFCLFHFTLSAADNPSLRGSSWQSWEFVLWVEHCPGERLRSSCPAFCSEFHSLKQIHSVPLVYHWGQANHTTGLLCGRWARFEGEEETHTHTHKCQEREVLLELSGDFFQIHLSSCFSFPPLLLNSGSVTLIHPIFKSSYDTISLHCSVSS